MPIKPEVSAINPFSGYLAQGSHVERTQATDKSRQIRRAQQLSRDVALRDDEMEHQVESSDAPSALKDDDAGAGQQQYPQQHEEPGEETPPHLDITA